MHLFLWVQCDQLPHSCHYAFPTVMDHTLQRWVRKNPPILLYFGQAFCQSSEKSNKYTRGESLLPKGAMGVPQHWVLLGDQKEDGAFRSHWNRILLKVEQAAKVCDAFLRDWLFTFITLCTHAQSKNMLFCVASCAGSTSTTDWPQALHFPRSCVFQMHGRSGLGSNYSLVISFSLI